MVFGEGKRDKQRAGRVLEERPVTRARRGSKGKKGGRRLEF